MAKPKSMLADRADRMAQALFVSRTSEPVPDHLIQLVDELETASKLGRLRKPDRAA